MRWQKNVTQCLSVAILASLLAGCSERAAIMDVGLLHDHQKIPLRSATIQGIVSQDGHFGEKKTISSTCHVRYASTANSCAAYYNEKYTGPGSDYAYAAQEGNNPQATKTLVAVTSGGPGAIGIVGTGLAVGSVVTGSVLGPAGILASFLVPTSGSSKKIAGLAALTDYNHQVKAFNAGKIFWVARYYPTQQWREGLNTASHMAITMDPFLTPGTWASGTVGTYLYRIHSGWWVDYQDGLFNWNWIPWISKPKPIPAILPRRLTWTVQPWKRPAQPFYILNSKNIEYPFMALATIEYGIQPGFNIPQWISAHDRQLAGWMVIYHYNGKAAVWKGGKITRYASPKAMVIPAKLEKR
ncbi:hypothetical protein JKG41_09945 [Acidithiobacillus sp. MC2.1]|nr:hypothetical protein [Acidithiobacillus sp. PG05]MBN6745378.1 hypothetical protein [Acidithiobacillus sp. MC2.2]MBN6748219.1 hypothetical protein [Acidithiobacillus sp. PG05]